MNKIYLLLTGMLLYFPSYSQRLCGSDEYLKYEIQNNPGSRETIIQNEQAIREYAAKYRSTNRSVVTVPVVFHVVYRTAAENIPDSWIADQLRVLNEDFRKLNADVVQTPSVWDSLVADCEIEFCFAQRDPQGNATNGITRTSTTRATFTFPKNDMKNDSTGGEDAWPSNQYLNIWICNTGAYYGWAILPWASTPANDGVVINYKYVGTLPGVPSPYNGGRTGTHEVGHWFGLRHIWGEGNCGNDSINDTPVQSTATFGCPAFPVLSCSNGSNGNMFVNFLDYTDDHCMVMFTEGQKERMWAAINLFRPGILLSPGCLPPPVGISENKAPSQFKSYFDRSRNILNIDFSENITGNIFLADITGRIVYQHSLQNTAQHSLPASGLKGIFFVRFEGAWTAIQKVHLL